MRIKIILVLLMIPLLTVMSFAQPNTPNGDDYQWELVVGGFDNPIQVVHAGDSSNRLFVVEQLGFVLVVENGAYLPEPFLDISELLTYEVIRGGYTERGMIGMVFHPNYAENGYFYVNYVNRDEDVVVVRYQVSADNPNRANPNSALQIINVGQPFPNHNGGSMEFSPIDGYLYISVGDGGAAGDPFSNGQRTDTLLGKILRIDVNTEPYAVPADNPFAEDDDFSPEIWAWGLRNVWRMSFDRATGDLYMADVGQEKVEEVNMQPATSTGGENYGWNALEGSERYNPNTAIPEPNVLPVAEYGHDDGCSITGGNVYRGTELPELDGIYFYGDYCNGRTWSLYFDDASGEWVSAPFIETGKQIVSFGEDEAGEIYLVDYKGDIYRLAHK
ncbi:MAG: PQQ-dependent sugar dehydrogenase [Phototrophicales bacterium]|nr:PQQ-dependent sugar dehydrogenase [Phototrophicales bacterium]